MSGGPATFHGRQNTRKEEEATRTNATTSVSKRAEGPPGMLDGLRDFCHLLSAEGQILYVSPATTMVTGHEPNKLVGRHIDDFIHADDKAVFKSEFYESIIHNKSTRFIYRFLRPNDSWTILESIFYPSTPVVSPQAALSQRSATGSQLLIVARPYASKNNALLDSFLEHKIEYERLLCQLQSLKSEEKGAELEDELETTPAQLQGAERPTTEAHESIETNDILKKAIRRSREQKQPATKVRSSLSTVGDLGIPVSESRDLAVPLKRKNTKRAKKEPHICMFCGTVNSPEWRKGPSGPKTLCNACGLRWAKSSTKMAQVSTSESDEDTMKQEE